MKDSSQGVRQIRGPVSSRELDKKRDRNREGCQVSSYKILHPSETIKRKKRMGSLSEGGGLLGKDRTQLLSNKIK